MHVGERAPHAMPYFRLQLKFATRQKQLSKIIEQSKMNQDMKDFGTALAGSVQESAPRVARAEARLDLAVSSRARPAASVRSLSSPFLKEKESVA